VRDIDDQALSDALEVACAQAVGQDLESIIWVASGLPIDADAKDDPLRAIKAGLEYHLVMYDEGRQRAGVFGPMMEFDGTCYPAPLASVDEIVPGVYARWERAMRLSPLDSVRARFADLLWEAKYGDAPHTFAQVAIDSYVSSSSSGFGHAVERREAVQRGVEIASQINDHVRRAAAVRAGVVLAEEALASDDPMPGVVFPLLGPAA
jgi:hypothetical protein